MSTAKECCTEGEPNYYNPKKDKGHTRRLSPIIGLNNPIPDEIRDPEDLNKLINGLDLVPYAGVTDGTGHSLLAWYLMLAKLSPMHGACMHKKTQYAVGGKVAFTRATDPEFETDDEIKPLTTAEQNSYKEAIKNRIVFDGGIRKLHTTASWEFQYNGNSFVELSVSKVLGEARANIRMHKTTSVMYRRKKFNGAQTVLISPIWTDDYLRKFPPREIPLWPNSVDDGGVIRTMFHLKAGNNTWYGRPESESSDLYKYREVQDAIYLIKQAASNFVGQLIIEVEDDDPETAPAVEESEAEKSGFDSFADRLEQNFTQKGDDPQAVLLSARPFGSRPMFVYQIKPNTNESWYKVTGEVAELKIMRSHGCTLRFMGFDAANGFSNDAFFLDFVLNMDPVIKDLRETITNFTNKILNVAWELMGIPQFSEYSITFKSPVEKELDALREKLNPAPVAPQPNQQTPQQP